MKKKSLLLSSICTIMLCLSIVVGSTFALFTSESKVNIAINSGKVNVKATINASSVQTKELYDTDYTAGADNTFDGNVEVGEESIKLNNFVPGDGVKFTIDVENNSNVTVQYRTKLEVLSDNGLFAGLVVKIDGEEYDGFSKVSNWATLTALEPIASIEVEIELPNTDTDGSNDNVYQDKACEIVYTVEAVQGNAVVEDVAEGGFGIFNEYDLVAFAKDYNADQMKYKGQTIEIMADMDMTGVEWTPIELKNTDSGYGPLVINGNGHTISNMTFENATSYTGFVGKNSGNLTINNLTFVGTTITGSGSYSSPVVGHAYGQTILNNVDVKDAYVYSQGTGNRIGGLIGFSESTAVKLTDCDVSDSTFIAFHNVGGLAGRIHCFLDEGSQFEATNNTVSNTTIIKTNADATKDNYLSPFACSGNFSEDTRAELDAFFTENGNTATNVTTITSLADQVTNAVAGDTVTVYGDKTVLPIDIADGVTIVGAEGSKVTPTLSEGFYRLGTPGNPVENVTFKNVTFKETVTFSGSATFIDCTFEQGVSEGDSQGDVTFIGCTFYQPTQPNTNKSAFHFGKAGGVQIGTLTITDCTFVGGVKIQGFEKANVTGCEFSGTYNWKYFVTYTTTVITDCTFADGLTVRDNASGTKITLVNTDVTVG